MEPRNLLPVEEALARVLKGAGRLGAEALPLGEAAGRTLAAPLTALRTQPPFHASAMDGYAVRFEDAKEGAILTLAGEAAAGHLFEGRLEPGQAVRIFTGGAVPDGADTVVIQENTERDGGKVRITVAAKPGQHIRGAGIDFKTGDELLPEGAVLTPRALGLAASAGHAEVLVARKPRVAILATGDELVPPGQTLSPGQIVASNSYMLAAIIEGAGAEARDYGIAKDRLENIQAAARRALEDGADVVVTMGGASVGEHDLVQQALRDAGMELDFWRIAMRPGRPMMYGRHGAARMMGLAGNPVSTAAGATLFLVPLIRALLGRSDIHHQYEFAVLGTSLAENDWRADHLRAKLRLREDGPPIATPLRRQDSSMMQDLARSDCLIFRPAHDPARAEGDACRIIRLGPHL